MQQQQLYNILLSNVCFIIIKREYILFLILLWHIYIYIKEKNYNIAIMFFLHRFAGSQFMASIEIDADFTDADYDLQSQRMTDLDDEVCSLLF